MNREYLKSSSSIERNVNGLASVLRSDSSFEVGKTDLTARRFIWSNIVLWKFFFFFQNNLTDAVQQRLRATLDECRMSLGDIEDVGKFRKQHTKFLLDMLGPASPKDGLQTPQSSTKVRVVALKAALFQDVVKQTWQLICKFELCPI